MNYKVFLSYIVFIIITLVILFLPYLLLDPNQQDQAKALRVMSYSSFINQWGAGPEVARLFEQKTGIPIQWINAGNAGLIIERLKFKRETDLPDIVVGLDQFAIFEARRHFKWLNVRKGLSSRPDLLPKGARFHDFLAYDWGALTFVYREGELPAPTSLDSLLDEQFKKKLIFQDPRISSPGLQFLLWVLGAKGEEEGLRYLEKLKPSILSIAPSWSASYNLFKMERPSIVFSYFTSPYYHKQDQTSYQGAVFDIPHPIQVEYAGIPDFCINCDMAKKFAHFLLEPDVQKIIMEKNYMFPVVSDAMTGSDFVLPKNVKYTAPIENLSLIKKKRELVNHWKRVFF